MNSTNLKEVQKVEIEMMDLVIDICEKYNIKYILLGGTMLGAIRDGGMIPWDDDIDIGMPREDFDKFVEIAKREIKSPYFFQTSLTDRTFKTQVRVRKNGTTAIQKKEWRAESHRGIYIDILPIDNIPDNEKDFNYEIGLIRSICSTRYIDAGLNRMRDDESLFKMRRMYMVMEDVIREYNRKYPNSEYVASVVGYRVESSVGFKYHRRVLETTKVPFKGSRHLVNVSKYYEDYLTRSYGNWRVPVKGLQDSNIFTDAYNDVSVYDKLEKRDWDKLVGEK